MKQIKPSYCEAHGIGKGRLGKVFSRLRGHSHITSALFGVSGYPWWCCKQLVSICPNPWYIYIADVICERLQS